MSDLVFITGGSGHIGSRVIFDALKAGYRVRAAVRSQSKVNTILSAPFIKSLNPGNKLEFAIVPDLLAEGAYDEAVKGATYAIHIASPITSAHKEGESYQDTLINPAVKGTLSILTAAKKSPSIKRVVITSSVVALISWADFTSGNTTTSYNEHSRTSFTPEPYSSTFEAYGASKIAAFNETESWLESNKASISFDVVNIFPGFVIGRDELTIEASDAVRGTNQVVLGPVLGGDASYTPGTSIHVQDVALAHVKALDDNVSGHHGYILTSGGTKGTKWEDLFDIVARNFPDAVKAGTIPNNGKITTIPISIDESASEKGLGFKFHTFEDEVKDVVGHYLELLSKTA